MPVPESGVLWSARVGAMPYIAPELYATARLEYDPIKADVYCLGMILYYLVHGRHPFRWSEDDQRAIIVQDNDWIFRDDVSEELKVLILGMTNEDVYARMTMEEVELSIL